MLVGKQIKITQHYNNHKADVYQHTITSTQLVNCGFDEQDRFYATLEIEYGENGYDQIYVYDDDTIEIFSPPHYNYTLTAELV